MSRDIRDLFARMAATPDRPLPPKPKPVANPKDDPPPRAKDLKTKKRPAKPKVSKPPLPPLLPASNDFTFVDSTRASHTDAPPNLGCVRVPTGGSGCLQSLTFTVTGTLDSITRETLKEIIEKYGGRLAKSVTGHTDILIRGVRDVGPSKLQTALERHIPVIDERGLFHILRQSSDQLEDEDDLSPPEPDMRPPPRPNVPQANVPALALPEPESRPPSSPLEPPSEPSPVIPPVHLFDAQLPHVVERPSLLLTERYHPKRLDELVGNQRQIEALQKWLRGFTKQDKKAVLISGPPGIGKSTAATLVAELRATMSSSSMRATHGASQPWSVWSQMSSRARRL
jgi:replication factor C subunit 1